MVFATDFDPTVSSARRKADHTANQAKNGQSSPISPVHQTNRLIAEAARSQAAAKRAASQKAALQKAAQRKPTVTITNVAAKDAMVTASVAALPLKAKPSLPLWLQVLNRVQHGSTLVASVLIAGALVLYGSSVYVDKSTERALTRLNQLQGESQQLTTANEAIKQNLAEQAMEENSGLEPYEAGDVIFVEPQPLRSVSDADEPMPERIRPLGY